MIYKVSVFIDQKNPETGKWSRTEQGLETRSGMVAFSQSWDDAESIASIEKNHLTSKKGCRLERKDCKGVDKIYSVNIVKIWFDEEGEMRNNWVEQSSCYYFETR